MLIDTHCHLNFEQLANQLPAVLVRAKEQGVEQYIIPGTSLATSQSAIRLAEENASVFAMIGVHPCSKEEPADMQWFRNQATHEKVVAIGEVGLDYFHEPFDSGVQAERLLRFAALAKEVNKPLVIHSRECFADMYTLLKEVGPTPFVVHCFTGSKEEATRYLDLGGLLSFTGIITYPKNHDLRAVVAHVPTGSFMLETDAPYLAPQAFRGGVAEPSHVRDIAACIAEVRGVSLREIAEQTTATARGFYGI